jgi:drug/metabolite transporter (DMT)-like permease
VSEDPQDRVPADSVATLAVLAAAAVGVQVGAATVASRFVIAETAPASLALMRYAIGFLCLFPVVVVKRPKAFASADLLPIIGLGIIQFGMLIALLNLALTYIPAGRAALILATMPLQTMLMASVLGRESLTAAKTAGVLLSFVGVALALCDGVLNGGGAGQVAKTWLGDAAVLGAALCGAICSVLYRPYLQRYEALSVSALAMFASVVFLCFPAAREGFFNHWPQLTARGWAAVAFVGLSSGVGYYLWLWALAHTTPTRASVCLALSPVTATALGFWLLSEPVTLMFGTGVLLVGIGLKCALVQPPHQRQTGSQASG